MRLLPTLLLLLAVALPLSATIIMDGEISGKSWLDVNRNGQIDSGEPAQPAEVQLISEMDLTTYTTTTDIDGNYIFSELPDARYTMIFIPEGRVIPTFAAFTYRPNGEGDSDIIRYSPPFEAQTVLFEGRRTNVVNAGWVDDGDICTEGSLRTVEEAFCSLSAPENLRGLTATVDPPNPNFTYEWSNGQTTQSVILEESQQYSVSVTDPAGCKYVQRGYFFLRNIPTSIDLPPVFFPCGEDTLRYRLPDSMLNSGFTFSGFSQNLLGLTIEELEAGTVNIAMAGQIGFSLTDSQGGCQITVRQSFAKPGPTDELYLETDSSNETSCGVTHRIQVRGGLFDRLDSPIPIGHTVQFFGPNGETYYNGEPYGNPSYNYAIYNQPPGTYTALVTSVCGPDRYLTITTPEAETCRSLSGRLVLDQSGGCSADGALPIPETMIAFTSTTGDREFYAFTGDDGVWSTDLPEDIYTVRPLTDPQLTASYCAIGEVTVSAEPLPGLDLVMARQGVCPVLTTEVLIPRLRREFQTISYVTYRNVGTGPAENVQLDVALDPFMEVVFSDTPFTRNGDTYTFAIGDLPPFSGGRIDLRYFLSGAELGQNHCISSSISPADLCTPPAGWQGGIVRTDYASCDGDALTFTVANTGDAATTVDVTYYVLRNGELQIPATSLGILPAGASRTIELPASGDTYQIFTNQEPNAPAATEPSAVAEGCGRYPDGSFAIGFANLFPVGNGLPGEAVACRINTGSYDPNEKLGYPLGVGIEKDIEPGTRITYDIHFQNTGTDTAIFVVIRDTLPETLDLSTLRLGGSSHDYTASLDTNRVLTFRFNNILLPDSTTNLAESQGLVQFSIDHDTSLVRGDRFQNNAAIFFDFNEPIITNYSQHRIAPEKLIDPTGISAGFTELSNASCGLTNGSLTVSTTAGVAPFTYNWSHDSSLDGPTATGLSAGTYSVTITAANDVMLTLEQGITASPAITETAAPNVRPTTCGEANGSIRLNISGGAGPLSYDWNHDGGLNSPNAEELAPGNYAVTVTDETGCSYSTTNLVAATPQPALRLESQQAAACTDVLGSASFILLNFSEATNLGIEVAGIIVSRQVLGPDSVRVTITNLPAGDYAPRVIDDNGCRSEVDLQIVGEPALSATAIVTPSSCTASSNGAILIMTTGGVGPYTYNWLGLPEVTTSEATGLPAGEYSVVISDANGCSFTLVQEVTEQGNNLSITVADSMMVTCAGLTDGSFTVVATGGPGDYAYEWSNGQSGPTATGLTGGEDYVVVVTDTNGCSSQLRVRLPDGTLLPLTGFPNDTFICDGDEYLLDLSAYTNQRITGSNGFTSQDVDLAGITEEGQYEVRVTNDTGCEAEASFYLAVTDSSFAAGISMAADAVIDLPFPVLEQSVPEPDSVSWSFAETVMLRERQDRTYFFDFMEPGEYTLGLVAYLRGCVDSTFAEVTIHADSSTITSILPEPATSIDLRVTPNPNQGSFMVTAELPVATRATALLYSPTGKILMTRELSRLATINERFNLALPAGVYFLCLLSDEGRWVVPVIIR